MILVQPMVQFGACARERRKQHEQHKRTGEDRLSNGAQTRGCPMAVHECGLKLPTSVAASLFPSLTPGDTATRKRFKIRNETLSLSTSRIRAHAIEPCRWPR